MSLADAQWARIEPLLPDRTPRRGGRWRDHWQVIDAIAFKYRTGTPWMDLTEHFGSWEGAHSRLRHRRGRAAPRSGSCRILPVTACSIRSPVGTSWRPGTRCGQL
ncbi:transposase [Streptomyces erythrochromogenes]|uniref:transposase n=1 Tax=Streptomyces erythrochromogenes TaxID=285574 RepID=UPI00367442ED